VGVDPPFTSTAPTQWVLLSFDLTPVVGRTVDDHRIVRALQEIRAARPAGHPGPEPTFILFVHTGYLQVDPRWTPPPGSRFTGQRREVWASYLGEREPQRGDVISDAKSPEVAHEHAARVRRFHEAGVELASHGTMHENGGEWTALQWRAEFKSHPGTLDLLGLPKPLGFRAPYLAAGARARGASSPLFIVEEEVGMIYDASFIGSVPAGGVRLPSTTIWKIPVSWVRDLTGRVTMLFGKDGAFTEEEYLAVLRKEFAARYAHGRAPLVMGGHGERLGALRRLTREVCYRPQVRCGTRAEYARAAGSTRDLVELCSESDE
jgi:peptidoglycan/xylan/chitin deacetylase (PgdA/CDA1 family)